MRRLVLSALALAALAVLPGCDGGGPEPVGLTGTWEGEIFDPNDAAAPRYPVELRLTDNGVTVRGSGSVDLPAGRADFVVTDGAFVGTIVDLDLLFEQLGRIGALSGNLIDTDPGRIRGTFNGPNEANGNVEIELVARRV